MYEDAYNTEVSYWGIFFPIQNLWTGVLYSYTQYTLLKGVRYSSLI